MAKIDLNRARREAEAGVARTRRREERRASRPSWLTSGNVFGASVAALAITAGAVFAIRYMHYHDKQQGIGEPSTKANYGLVTNHVPMATGPDPESNLDRLLANALSSHKNPNKPLDEKVDAWTAVLNSSFAEGDYSAAGRSAYNICYLLEDGGKLNATKVAADNALKLYSNHRSEMGKNEQKYHGDFYLFNAKAYAKSKQTMGNGVKMYENYFRAILAGKETGDDGDIIEAVLDIVDAQSNHKSAREKFRAALSLLSPKEQGIVISEIKTYEANLDKSDPFKTATSRALRTYEVN